MSAYTELRMFKLDDIRTRNPSLEDASYRQLSALTEKDIAVSMLGSAESTDLASGVFKMLTKFSQYTIRSGQHWSSSRENIELLAREIDKYGRVAFEKQMDKFRLIGGEHDLFYAAKKNDATKIVDHGDLVAVGTSMQLLIYKNMTGADGFNSMTRDALRASGAPVSMSKLGAIGKKAALTKPGQPIISRNDLIQIIKDAGKASAIKGDKSGIGRNSISSNSATEMPDGRLSMFGRLYNDGPVGESDASKTIRIGQFVDQWIRLNP
jgi:hypothetical protein